MAKESFNQRFPPYIPLHYRLFALYRKLYRQSCVRIWEDRARKHGCPGLMEDSDGRWTDAPGGRRPNPAGHINKSAFWMDEDLNRPDIKAVADQLAAVKDTLSKNGLMFCSAAGTFVKTTYTSFNERKKLWEDTWVLCHAGVKPGMRVLDIGGASTPFSFYLASIGCSVVVVDNDWGNCGTVYNVNAVGKKMGWDIRAIDRDIAQGLPFPDETFDRVFSICVIEHLTSETRRLMMREAGRVLKRNGLACLTTDYDHERKVLTTDKGLRFGYQTKFRQDVLDPSGLQLIGNRELIDFNPEDDFLGAFFLQKPARA